MALNIKKHPIHPILVSFPIALFGFSFLGDIIYLLGGGAGWPVVAYYSMGAGVVFGLLAAIPGFVDLYHMPSGVKAKEIGIWHMGVNLAVVFLFAINFYIRGKAGGGMDGTFLLSLIGIAALCVSGWLGGEMVYRYGAGIDLEEEGPSKGEVVEIKREEPPGEHRKAA